MKAVEVSTLLERVARLEAKEVRRQSRQSRRLRGLAVFGVVTTLLLSAGAALSQSSDCAPSSIVPFCFSSGEAASATQVNQNFKGLASALTSLEGDVSANVSQSELTTALASKLSVSGGDVTVNGSLKLGLRLKDCSAELDAANNTSEKMVDCFCASDEVAIGGGGWGSPSNTSVLRESRPTIDLNGWRIVCGDVDDGAAKVACSGMKIICAKMGAL